MNYRTAEQKAETKARRNKKAALRMRELFKQSPEADRVRRREYYEKHREHCIRKSKEYQAKYPEHRKARNAVNTRVTRGDIVRPCVCEKCGGAKGRIECHHGDYDKWYVFAWLCAPCHREEHRKWAV